jgi:hypothetical protein
VCFFVFFLFFLFFFCTGTQKAVGVLTQVSAKHRETKRFYTLYNTLDDTKLYMTKEEALLTSIHDNFERAMASPCLFLFCFFKLNHFS